MKQFLSITLGCIWLLLGTTSLSGQNSDAPKQLSRTYYLQNCFVVTQPGTTLSGQNVLIKDGFIAGVGASLKIPYNAQVVKADSMYVYAGFIDAYSNTGVANPDKKDRPKLKDPGNPPNNIAGIMPQVLAEDVYSSTEKSVSEMRSAGFGISHVIPRGLMLPGQGSVILLGESSSDKMLVKSAISQNFQLVGNRGVYPATTIAVMAKFRDLYQNAKIAGNHIEKYKTNSVGLARPDYSMELVALYPMTAKKQPLFFTTENSKDVHKALSLKNELGFDLVLTEVKQGWYYLDKIKQSNVPVLLSLDLPNEEKKEEKKDAKLDKDGVAIKDSTDTKPAKKIKTDPETEAYDTKKAASVKEYLGQAALFEKNNIPFGFSYMNVKTGHIKKNIKKLIDNGLSESAALAALTTNPAKLLGIGQIAGTIEKGKIANLVITDKSFFDDKSTIKYVFVDGEKYDYLDKKKKQESGKTSKIAGDWSYIVEIPGSTQKGKLQISEEADTYKVSVLDDSSPNESDEAMDVALVGNNLTFYIIADLGSPTRVDFDLSIDKKEYSGTVNVSNMGSFPIKGEFIGDPK